MLSDGFPLFGFHRTSWLGSERRVQHWNDFSMFPWISWVHLLSISAYSLNLEVSASSCVRYLVIMCSVSVLLHPPMVFTAVSAMGLLAFLTCSNVTAAFSEPWHHDTSLPRLNYNVLVGFFAFVSTPFLATIEESSAKQRISMIDDNDKCIPKWGSLKESNLSRTLWWMLQLRGWPELFQHKHASPGCIPPAHCDAWIKLQIRNDAMKGCGGKNSVPGCSRLKTSKRLANFCLFKSFLDSAMLKHAENLFRGSSNSNTNSGGYWWHVVQCYERSHGFSPLSAGCNFQQRAMCSLLAALRNWLLRGTDSGSKYHSPSKSIN